ncbi:MAG TPA: acyl-CoA dehydrogenase family protein [Frankiaceae bacterium]|nr:acyl-CoA dehydrogenase family protein [Frankiaceae bacterium]
MLPEPRNPDAAAAARLARSVLARSGPSAPALASVGLLDESLPDVVRVEVLRECGSGAGCAFGLSVADDDLGRAAVLCGAGEAAAVTGMAYARERVVFGRPLATMAVQRYAFASVAGGLEAALALVRRVAASGAGGGSLDAAAVLPVALDAAWAAVEAALQVHGGYGYTDEYPVSRMWREVAAARAALGGV